MTSTSTLIDVLAAKIVELRDRWLRDHPGRTAAEFDEIVNSDIERANFEAWLSRLDQEDRL